MSLFKTTVNGMAWSLVSTIIRSVVSFLQVSILTSYLTKADFGLVAICNIFIGFTKLFLDLGISAGIMHKQEITRHEYSSLFWLNILTGLLLTIILLGISSVVAIIYNDSVLKPLLMILSFTVLFSSMGSQHRTVQQKNMRFRYISVIEIATSLLTLALAIFLVKTGFGIYSLVYSTLFNAFFYNLVFLLIGLFKDNNISFHFKMKETFPFLRIGLFSVGSECVNYFSREFDVIIISALLGKEQLGLYSLCKKLVLALYESITPIMNKVLTPMLATLQSQKDRIRKIYLDIVETVAITNYPFYAIVAIFSYGIICILYGETYTDGRYVLGLLALYYGFLTTGSPVGGLQTALGRTDAGLYWNLCRVAICAVSVFVGSIISLEAVVVVLIITNLLFTPLFWKITIFPLIGGLFKEYLRKILLPLIMVLIIVLPFYLITSNVSNVIFMVLLSLFFFVLYFGAVILFFNNSYLVERIKPYFNRFIKISR